MTKPTIDEVRSALIWLKTEPNAPKHFTKAGNEHARKIIWRILTKLEQDTEKLLEEITG